MPTTSRPVWRARDILATSVIAALVVFGLVGLWHASAILMFVFLGILFGLALTSGVDRLARFRIPRALGALLLLLLVASVLAGLGALIAPTLSSQLTEIRTRLPEAAAKIEAGFNARLRGEFGAWTGLGTGASRAARTRPAAAPPAATKTPGTKPAPTKAPTSQAPTNEAPANQAPANQPSATPSPGSQPAPTSATPTTDSAAERAPTSPPAGGAATPASADSARPRGPRESDSAHAAGAAAAESSASRGRPASGGTPSGALNFQSQLSSGLATVAQHALGVIGSTVELIIYLLLVVFLAVYIAVEPDLYYTGLLHLIPHAARPRAREVLVGMAGVMRRWLLTQVIAMVTIGVIWGVALSILHVKAALALAVIAALLEFVPTIGPTIAAVPAIAVGILDSPQKGLEVIGLYLLVQGIESNILIPMLMKGQIDLPPGLTIVWQALMALAFGFLGLLVAVPLLAAIVVAVKMLYVRDVVGDDIHLGRAAEGGG